MAESYIKALKELGKVGEIRSAAITGKHETEGTTFLSIETIWSFKDYVNKERRTVCASYIHNTKTKVSTKLHSTIQDKEIILRANSMCGKKSAHILQSQNSCLLNVMNDGELAMSMNLKDEDIHGKVYNDEIMSSIAWSQDSRYLAYIAEKKRLKHVYYMSKMHESGNLENGDLHLFYDDWGELLTDHHQSVIAVVDTLNQKLWALELPENLSPGQVVWSPEGLLVGTAFEPRPFRQGLMYCKNRDSLLFQIDFKGNFSELTDRGNHVRTPRFSPDGERVVFFQTSAGGPHVKSTQLRVMDWKTKESSVLIDYIPRKITLENSEPFLGLCGASVLPIRCWSDQSDRVVFSALDNFGLQTYVIDLESKEIKKTKIHSWLTAYDVKYNYVLGSSSSFTEAPRVALIPLDSASTFSFVSKTVNIPEVPEEWQEQWDFVNPNPHPVDSASDLPIPATYIGPLKPAGDEKQPLIVWLHGGPHSIVPNRFWSCPAYFVSLGCSVLIPNFRGSLGQGRDALESLPGHCGVADVDDVYNATLQCLKRYPDVLDENKVLLFGGSYGGFLVTYLSAQHPDLYKVATAFNPVTEFSSMATTGDIFDWSFIETGQSYRKGQNLTPKAISRMFEMSPLNRVDDVRAPTLLLLGTDDRRVHMSQGLFYHKMLLARNVPTKVLVYNDCHTLTKIDSEVDWLIQTFLWYKKYC